MPTKEELENKTSFRFMKVIFVFLFCIVLGLTIFVWYFSREKIIDASQAYIACNHAKDKQFALLDQEKQGLADSNLKFFSVGSDAQTRINKLCYQDYSGIKDPNLASQSDINLFRAMETGQDGRIYTIQGIQEKYNWHSSYLIIAIVVELIIFAVIKFVGFYIMGGKEAID